MFHVEITVDFVYLVYYREVINGVGTVRDGKYLPEFQVGYFAMEIVTSSFHVDEFNLIILFFQEMNCIRSLF